MKYNKKSLIVILLLTMVVQFILKAEPIEVKLTQSEVQSTENSFLSSEEKQLLKMINDMRIENKLKAFEVDSVLTRLAREHSQEMVQLKYFNALSPKKGTPKERAAGIIDDYPTFAFVSKGNSVTDAFRSLTQNKEAKEIIFSDNKALHIGIGTAKDINGDLFCTFHFSNRVIEIESSWVRASEVAGSYTSIISEIFLYGRTKEKFIMVKAYGTHFLPENNKIDKYVYSETTADDSGNFKVMLEIAPLLWLKSGAKFGIEIMTKPTEESEYMIRSYLRGGYK